MVAAVEVVIIQLVINLVELQLVVAELVERQDQEVKEPQEQLIQVVELVEQDLMLKRLELLVDQEL